jgi:hypothetical protein
MLQGLPRTLLHAEGLAVGAAAVSLYFHAGYSWWLLVALALAPDLSAVGYVAGPRAGAASYDALHTYVGPVALATAGVLSGTRLPVELALIWLTHIGVDRLLGYGLKYPSGFKDTHLQRI